MAEWDFGDRYKHSDQKGANNRPGILEGEFKVYKPKYDKNSDTNYNRLDIVPFIAKSKKHPLIANGTWKGKHPDYVLDIWVHTQIGAKKGVYVCPLRTYGKPCPICEERQKAYDRNDPVTGKNLKPKRRVLYNVISRNRGDEDDILIFDVSWEWFEQPLRKAAKSEGEETGADIDYAHPVKGKTVRFDAVDSGLNDKFIALKYDSFKFFQREETLEKHVEKAFPLDEMLILHSYEELQKILFAGDEEGESEEEEGKPSEGVKAKEPVEAMPCPNGHVFGRDTDGFKDCSECPNKTWTACDKASR